MNEDHLRNRVQPAEFYTNTARLELLIPRRLAGL